ncbi:MAG: endonuclease/exonuclease/phosphatase family protein [Prevotella sp.]|nr:endonuclease/exonuclease/phosphatase family protein [Prevotella sp.]
MKRISTTLALMAFAIVMTAQGLFVGTYNVRYANSDDAEEGNGWTRRVPVLCGMINFEEPDIFGTQEALIGQLKDMLKLLPQYDYIGVAREDGKEDGEHSAIFYRKDKFKLLDHGDFWLSETPDKPSLGWDAACVRICTWGKFKDTKTKLQFYYFNLHMDHVGRVARREGAKLVMQKIHEIAGDKAPVILTGDFNVDQHDEIFSIFKQSGLLSDAYEVAEHRFAENGTFTAYMTDRFTKSRIDHILVTKNFKVRRYGVLTNAYWTPREDSVEHGSSNTSREFRMARFDRRMPSDHYPVFAKIEYHK